MVEIAPKRHKNVLNYTKIANEVIYPLIHELNIGLFVADRWNSLKLMHDIEDECGIYTDQHSLTADEFAFIYDHITDEENRPISFPRPEIEFDKVIETDLDDYPHCFGPGNKTTGKPMPVAHFVHQSHTVTENARGIVDKGPGYTDDLFRATCLFLNYALDSEAVEEYELLTGEIVHKKRAVGAMGGSSGGPAKGGGAAASKIGAVSGASGGSSAGGGNVFVRNR
ncbi:HintN domain-containing protein [Vibrio phage vB_VcorM_GR11A]|nr:HintN domain-containing protein [Vibrio phage vB_VcorM_GR11A]